MLLIPFVGCEGLRAVAWASLVSVLPQGVGKNCPMALTVPEMLLPHPPELWKQEKLICCINQGLISPLDLELLCFPISEFFHQPM